MTAPDNTRSPQQIAAKNCYQKLGIAIDVVNRTAAMFGTNTHMDSLGKLQKVQRRVADCMHEGDIK